MRNPNFVNQCKRSYWHNLHRDQRLKDRHAHIQIITLHTLIHSTYNAIDKTILEKPMAGLAIFTVSPRPVRSTFWEDGIPMLKLTMKIAAKIVEAINHFDDRNFQNNGGFEPITSYFLSLILGTGSGLSIISVFFASRRKKSSHIILRCRIFLSLLQKNIPLHWFKKEAWGKFEEFPGGGWGEKGNKKE